LRAPTRLTPAGTFLIVDDDLDDAKLARRMVVNMLPDAKIVLCATAQEGLAYLESGGAPFLILLDLKMPEMDGFAFLEWLKTHPAYSSIPVVVLSGLHELQHLKRAYALHARAFLVKPITPESLRSVLLSLNFAV
jgi:CheY-like chemotaxis protein